MTDGLGGAALLAFIALVPLVVLMLTSFVKISIVLALLRNALGAPDAPSGLVVMGVSLVLTFFVMAPVGIDMVRAAQPAIVAPPGGSMPGGASAPSPAGVRTPPAGAGAPSAPAGSAAASAAGSAAPGDAVASSSTPQPLDVFGTLRVVVPDAYKAQVNAAERALVPLRDFLVKHADPRDRETFATVAERMGRAPTGDEIWVLAPAFLTTELREAFAIAVLLFLPFLVLDLVVALGLAALGLSSTQPSTIALPLKLLLFVSVDGWRLLVDSLLRGYV